MGKLILLVLVSGILAANLTQERVRGPFGLSLVATGDGKPVAPESFGVLDDCSVCHARHAEEFDGSLHSVAHHDSLYRAFAEMARREAGEEVYAYCSGCHAPGSVVSGLVPGTPESEVPDNLKAGVQCDVCHQVSALSHSTSPWGEPGNGSLVFTPGRAKAARSATIKANPAHEARQAEFLGTSEFCAACHTVIHPFNGLRIEHTYDEWKNSVYAQHGIQCQDCHMRSVADARTVASTLQRVQPLGRSSEMSSEDRPISPHRFVGGNVDAERVGGGADHAAEALERLKSAAKLGLEVQQLGTAGSATVFTVLVENIGAGHSLPTSLTELREMWVHVRVVGEGGAVLFESGALDEHGEVPREAFRFGSQLLDRHGKPTFKPWEAVTFGWKRTIAPKGVEKENFRFDAGQARVATIELRLLYRIAPPHVVKAVMGEKAFEPSVVEMATHSVKLQYPK